MFYEFKSNEDVKQANLSFYTLSMLADYMQRVYPMHAMDDFLKCNELQAVRMRTDELGNFVCAACIK